MSKLSVVVAALLIAPCVCQADVIFNSFGPNDTFGASGTGTESFDGTAREDLLSFGQSFTVKDTSYFLSEITLPLTTIFGASQITLRIFNTVSGQPGQPLETFSIGGISFDRDIFTVNSNLQPLLVKDQSYWVIGTVPSNALDVSWLGIPNDDHTYPTTVGPYQDGHWKVFGSDLRAFRVEGTSVPEPASWALAASALLFLNIKFKRRLQ